MRTIILMLIVSCTTASAEFKIDLANVQDKNKKQSKECLHQKDIIEKTFQESENEYISILSEKQTNTILDQFNFDLRNNGFFHHERFVLLKKECNENNIGLFLNSDDYDCGIELSDAVFFNTIIEKSKKSKWSKITKKHIKQSIVSYAEVQMQKNHYNLLGLAVAVHAMSDFTSVLSQSSKEDFELLKKIKNKVDIIIQESAKDAIKSSFSINCENIDKVIANKDDARKRIKALLKESLKQFKRNNNF